MKWLFLIALLLFVGACVPSQDTPYIPSGIRETKSSSLFDVSLFVNPDPGKRNVTLEDGLRVGFYLVNRDKNPVEGFISLEDTPNEQDFGGISGKASESFLIEGVDENKKQKTAILFPGNQPIFYDSENGGLKSTSFIGEVRYVRDITLTSNDFWIRDILQEKPLDCKNNCNTKNGLTSNSPFISVMQEEIFDFDGDFQVDSMQVEFSVQEGDCDLISSEKVSSFEPLEEKESILIELSLQESGNSFICKEKENKDKKRKTIICVIDNSLIGGDYADRIIGNIQYGCKLILKSGEIKFG